MRILASGDTLDKPYHIVDSIPTSSIVDCLADRPDTLFRDQVFGLVMVHLVETRGNEVINEVALAFERAPDNRTLGRILTGLALRHWQQVSADGTPRPLDLRVIDGLVRQMSDTARSGENVSPHVPDSHAGMAAVALYLHFLDHKAIEAFVNPTSWLPANAEATRQAAEQWWQSTRPRVRWESHGFVIDPA